MLSYDLERFLDAQAPVYEQAHAELMAGHKRTHWMWFIFPQLRGLGQSTVSRRYAITDLAEAGAYLAHPVLGNRLRACVSIVNGLEGRTLKEIFGSPDDLKFCSSMTLFSLADPDEEIFRTALNRFCDGQPDAATRKLLSG